MNTNDDSFFEEKQDEITDIMKMMSDNESLSIRSKVLSAADRINAVAQKLRKATKKDLDRKELENANLVRKNLLYTVDTLELIAKKLHKAAKKALGERELESALEMAMSNLYVALAMYAREDTPTEINVR